MLKFHVAAVLIALSELASAAETKVVGYFQTEPGVSGDTKGLCVTNLQHNNFKVQIRAGYCPSKECLNYRPDGISFEAVLKNKAFLYSNYPQQCRLQVSFGGKGATVIQNDRCSDGDHPNLSANGYYKFVGSIVDEDLCNP